MEQYTVTGMSCAACQLRVEKAVNAVEGVESCAVSLLTNSMGVEGTARPEDIIAAVEAAGYGANLRNGIDKDGAAGSTAAPLRDTETPEMKKRLIASVILLLPLMYVSMGHMLLNLPLPGFLEGNHVAMGLYQMVLSGLILVINQKFFINGFKGLIKGAPNMDTLVALGSAASYIYSVAALFLMTGAVLSDDSGRVMYYMDSLYFEAAAMILTLITVGKMLEARSKGKTTDALKGLMDLSPTTAVVIKDGVETTVPIDKVRVGDRFVVRPGDSIPVDGIVREGESAVNEAALTGESVPVEKKAGDTVSAATINTSGYMVCEATRVGEDTTLSAIIKLVSDAAATKAPIAKTADKVAGVFVPAVIGIALVTFTVWLILGRDTGYAMARAVSVLVISCPCALGLATPVAIMVGNGVGAKTGILFKTAASLEQAGRTQIVALDKTGTITAGEMKVTDVIALNGATEEELLRTACALESKSEHPISKAVTEYAKERDMIPEETTGFEALSGKGLKAELDGHTVCGGNLSYIGKVTNAADAAITDTVDKLAGQGKTPVLFSRDDKILGIIGVSDVIKDDSAQAIKELKDLGIHVVMLTGDNKVTAAAIASQAGVDEVAASVMPDGKEAVIRQLMEHGMVTMVGDGINDAPALTAANLGIAIGAGTDVAIDAADVVLMKNSLRDAAAAIRISRSTLRNIHENLFWAFFYNCMCIPLAAGCYAALGLTLNPMIGAAAMGLSSFCVVTNALRLNLIKPYDNTKDKKVSHPVTGELIKDKTDDIKISEDREEKKGMEVKVKGMMCAHCEAHVKKALEAIDGIESAEASHEKELVTITTSKDVDEAAIKAAVEDAGYEYVGV